MKFPGILHLLAAGIFLAAVHPVIAADELAWPPITAQTRPWAWWWWHGSAVDETNIARELRRFSAAGLGGVQIIPIYGVKNGEDRDIRYLSPAWMNLLNATVTHAHQLGMDADMTLGTGWCFGGPTVSDTDANANVVAKKYELGVGERISEKFKRGSLQALVAFGPDGKSVDLTDAVAADGTVNFSPPGNSIGDPATAAKTWTVYAVSQKPSGQKVKRPAPGGEGWMLNPAYPQALRDWLPWFDAAFTNYAGAKPRAVFQDSYEYRTDWSPDFLAQFEKYRGYKLQDELPALFGNAMDDHAARVKYDYRRTLSDIMVEESEPAWIAWAHTNGFITTYQAHGTPGNWLDLYAAADVPETEMFHNDRNVLIAKFASSAAHVKGGNLVGAETGTWLKEHFTETLADVKYLADDMFLSGVNHVFYHGACYSPDDAAWPGWVFYASTEMNPRNSIWHDVRTLNDYIARCQSVLQTGKPDNDILLYWPVADFWSNPNGRVLPMTVSATDWFTDQSIGKTARELWNQGYAFDYVSDRQLRTAKVVAGKIKMPGGDYKVIVVPECKCMPLETLRQLFALAHSGALVIFEGKLSMDVAGWSNLAAQRGELKQLISGLVPIWNGDRHPSFDGYTIGAGRIYTAFVASGLASLAFEKEFVRESMVDEGISFIRRTFNGGWNYFIANRGATNFDGWITLARPAKSFAMLNPMTGDSGMTTPNVEGQIHLQLAAGESVIVRAFDHALVNDRELKSWNNWQTNGSPQAITGSWNVSFVQGGPTIPASFQITQLGSWTASSDANAQNFAGSAKYEITFDAPTGGGENYFLDLGEVCQSARVTLNGKAYGTLITPPFRVVVNHLKPTGNKLEVEVTNVSANRIRDLDRRGVNWKIFKDTNVVNENYKPFNAADWPLTDSGLLGPVTLTAVK